MLNKLLQFVREHDMIHAGDHVICAVSGGADSMALLFAMKLLRDKLGIRVSAAHYNHHLRGEESDRDAAFVAEFCKGYCITLYNGEGNVVAGKKGLEAAAREARYAFFATLPGKVATAHTADDNAETVLMHLVRGTGLKGLGGIAPIKGQLIRPMLSVTREDVLHFMQEYHIQHIEDSSNGTDDFLRNRIRHHVIPLLKDENPQFAINTSSMALRLREDDEILSALALHMEPVSVLRKMEPGKRNRLLSAYLIDSGVREPEAEHVRLLNKLVFSDNPSAKANFPGGICISRNYDSLEIYLQSREITPVKLNNPGFTTIDELGVRVYCGNEPALNCDNIYHVTTTGDIYIRSRQSGDKMRLLGGTRSLKRLLIDRKIPASKRNHIVVIADDIGVLAVIDIGVNLDRISQEKDGTYISIEKIKT